jgi:DNA invertase Pin-like site-specific DNA recombinase
MRVVTYARVSSERQGAFGKSLVSQNQKFGPWCERGGHEIVRSYEERQSATTTVRRRLFTQMLNDLDETKPEMIVVDSADRFSRNLEDVFDVMKRLRERGINIWPLEWERDDPPDIITYDSPDYLRFREEIIAAQAEAKRIKTRVNRSVAARRERGETVTSKPPFGVRREGVQLVPSIDASIVNEMDAKILAGEPMESVADWIRAIAPRAWKSRQGIWSALSSPSYVAAGVRTPEIQAQLNAFVERARSRFSRHRKFEHEFAGVFACGRCIALGMPESEALMGAWNAIRSREGGRLVPSVGCQHNVSASTRRHPPLTFVVSRLETAWSVFIDGLTDDAIERWAAGAASTEEAARRRDLERAIARTDQDEAAFASRRARAFELLNDREPALVSQARRALIDLERDERELARQRTALRTALAGLLAPARRPDVLRTALEHYRGRYAHWTLAERNRANRLLCEVIGSPPRVERTSPHGWALIRISWPTVAEAEVVDAGLVNRAAPRRMHSLR